MVYKDVCCVDNNMISMISKVKQNWTSSEKITFNFSERFLLDLDMDYQIMENLRKLNNVPPFKLNL